MTRLVGTATWVGAAEGGGGAPMSWMGSEGLAGGGPPVFGAVLAARRDKPELRCSRSPSRPPFHILRRKRGQPRRRLFTSHTDLACRRRSPPDLRAELCAPKYVCGQSAKKGAYGMFQLEWSLQVLVQWMSSLFEISESLVNK
ncbi:uncharacterized protein LOC116634575 [Phoca vitulina]|uniref:uncharacterized protein LOC116634575 n=1 Tax=Phoca vitulina TaxID=9720 RepID=UPI0013960259|nr:uncharacterized protein LOC116634575 [Phoca vitulina]